MFEAAVAILKAIWPYLRESLFEGGTVLQWIRKYKAILIWLGLVFTLFMINSYMFDQYVNLQIERNNLVTNYNRLYTKYHHTVNRITVQNKQMMTLGAQLESMRAELEAKKTELAEVQADLDAHRRWERNCGLNTSGIESGGASCPVAKPPRIGPGPGKKPPNNKPKPPQTVPQPEPVVKKPTFAEKLKRIFGSGEK